MQPHILIVLNGTQFQLGQPLPDQISSVRIEYHSMFPIPLSRQQYAELVHWFNTIISRCTNDYIEFNGVLIPTSEVNKAY